MYSELYASLPLSHPERLRVMRKEREVCLRCCLDACELYGVFVLLCSCRYCSMLWRVSFANECAVMYECDVLCCVRVM